MGQLTDSVRVIRHWNDVIYAWRGREGSVTGTIHYDDCIAHISMHDFPDNRPYYGLCAVLDVMEPTTALNSVRFYHMTIQEWRAICYECQRDRVHNETDQDAGTHDGDGSSALGVSSGDGGVAGADRSA